MRHRSFVIAYATLAVVLAGCLAGCKDKRCKAEQTDLTPGGVRFAWQQCPDGNAHTVECTPVDARFQCVCSTPGAANVTFTPPQDGRALSTELISAEDARTGCKLDFEP